MTLLEHLEELRRRVIIIIVAVVSGAVAGFVVSAPVLDLLRAPLPEGHQLGYLSPAAPLAAQLKIAGFLGIAVALPIVLYNLWRFVTPGLTRPERRLVWPMLTGAMILFAAGVGVGFFSIPFALRFLLGFGENLGLEEQLTVDEYIGFVTTMLLAFGLIFQFPIVLLALARAGILSHRFLASRRRWAVLLIVLLAIIATPGGDPISPLLLSATMYLLFEGTLLLVRLMRR